MTDLFSSQFFVVFFSVGVPISIFFVLLFFFVLRPGRINLNIRRSSNPSSVQPNTFQASSVNISTQQPPQPSTQSQPQQDLSKITSRVDKMQADLAKMITDTSTELKQSIDNLGKGLEDLALAIKATKSDAESPFNFIPINEPEQKSEIPAKSTNLSTYTPPSNNSSSQAGLPKVDIRKLVQLSILLAILDYDKVKIRALLNLGLITPEDLELIAKIEDIIQKNRPKIDATELALIAYDIAKSYDSADSELVRYMSVLLGDGNGRRNNQ
ncbi:hypothetical protein L3N51_02017 [Metallosphaera sp. J1]|uniref:hypothetical protein n=1 Tax=Metallosphaera javensis (ex Hofmann et al. 2022) TaxID=99938 RepID=UPI001EDFA16E|nr:hypothetical protein [Metallosphaera javensis (ex Hofmann et al. 2022)]MCG3109722.1 hypothetical protein [Metallosphaera javensis (ex Hofmann et al. 2022)]